MTSLLGLNFANLTVAQSASRIAVRPDDAPFGYVVTPNAHHLVRLNHDPQLRAIYRAAALCLLDSRVVAALSWLLGLRVPVVTPGSDLTAELLAHHLRPGEKITIVGLAPIWLPVLVTRFGLAVPAHYNPPVGFDSDPAAFAAAVAFVRAHPSRFVFLAVGSPRQEYLAAAIAAAGDATGTGLCIGASLDYLAGVRRRAPLPMQRLGLEWLFRLVSDPRRMARRYLIESPAVIALLLRERLAAGRSG
jgi:N-acetylglucosaminyldiphosphoundecaprenol N-acetyl-beta-D-mannosaminyltransferase